MQRLHFYLDAVFRFKPELKHIELKNTDNADDYLFHTGIVFLEDLDRAFLRYLHNALDELLAFHRIHLPDLRKMFGSKCRDSFILNLHIRCAHRISDRENAGIEHTDDITRIGLADALPFLSHKLLGLGKTQFLLALDMINFLLGIEFARTYSHEGYPVTVGLIHIRLDLKYKCRKSACSRIDHISGCRSRKRRRRHLEEILKEILHTEVVECRPEEYRCQFSLPDTLKVKSIRCSFNELYLLF